MCLCGHAVENIVLHAVALNQAVTLRCASVFVHAHVLVCVLVHAHVLVCVLVRAHVLVCVLVHAHVLVCVLVHAHVLVCVLVLTHMIENTVPSYDTVAQSKRHVSLRLASVRARTTP